MKYLFCLLSIFILSSSLKPAGIIIPPTQCYDPSLVDISKVTYKDDEYVVVLMRRDGERIRAKYFAASEPSSGKNVYQRYTEWSAKYKNIILVSSGTYMDNNFTPEGLTIDNGIPVNENLIYNKMDALVIVYATGGVVVTNLNDGDLTLKGGGIEPSRKFNLRSSVANSDLDDFMVWAKSQEATVFQTHLLVYKNQIKISQVNSSDVKRERRFLAVGKDESGKVVHVIIHCPQFSTIYEGTRKTLEFLNDFKDMEVTFMINLDTGFQDVFELHNSDCSTNEAIKGQKPLFYAVNLLAYYYQ